METEVKNWSNGAFELSGLTAEAKVYSFGAFHLYVDEKPSERYRIPDIVNSNVTESEQAFESSEGKIQWSINSVKYVLYFRPFRIECYLHDELLLVLNDRDKLALDDSEVSCDFKFTGSSHLYGIPSHSDGLVLENTTDSQSYRLYNLDIAKYPLDSRGSIYGAVPFLCGIGHKGRSVGVFWNNSSETWIDIENSYGKIKSEAGVIDVFIMVEENPKTLAEKFTMLTGPPHFPPLFSLGYHQCRWNYESQEDLLGVMEGFDTHEIPLDVLWLDIDHTPERQYFNWNYELFPTPLEMQQIIEDAGRKLVNIVDPHLKRSDTYKQHVECRDQGFYVKNPDGTDFEGDCWPGNSSWPDFIDPKVREWWGSQFSQYVDTTSALHIWNDMNEPSVFSGPELTMPKDKRHGKFLHKEVHNVYGAYMHQATFEGLVKRDGKRPFVLSRSFFAGTQRWGAIWTGDNAATWQYLAHSIPMLLSLSVSGISFCGADVGGFFDNPEESLLIRWYQTAAYTPFFRGHAHCETKRREPWLFSENTLNLVRIAIRERYQLLPYWYSLFYEHSQKGTPIMRPLFIEFPEDSRSYKIDREFMLGSALLVCPSTTEETQYIYIPTDRWFDYHTFEEISSGFRAIPTNPEYITVLLRGGSVICRQDTPRRSSKWMKTDPFTLIIALDEQQSAKGVLYMDDGESFDYVNGEFLHANIEYNENQIKYTVNNLMQIENAIVNIIIIGRREVFQRATLNETSEITIRDSNTLETNDLTMNADWSITLIS